MSKYNKSNQYTRYYGDFAGVDLSSSPSNAKQNRFADMQNMYRDYYGSDGSLCETVPGFRRLFSFSNSTERRKINALLQFSPYWDDKEYIAVHAGKRLFLYPIDCKDSEDMPELSPQKLYKNGKAEEYAELEDGRSVLFEKDGTLYILDGKSYFYLDEHGLRNISDGVYIPTIYSDGNPYEQKNMLTGEFYCQFNLSESIQTLNRYRISSESIIYNVTGESTCEVTGTSDRKLRDLYIPSQTEIAGQTYTVESIAPYAFYRIPSLKTVHIAEGVKRIGKFAFADCDSLVSAVFPDSLIELGEGVLWSCGIFTSVTLGPNISSIPRIAFKSTALSKILYSGSVDSWVAVEKNSENPNFYDIDTDYHVRNCAGDFIFYINEPCAELFSVTLDGKELSPDGSELFYTPVYEQAGDTKVLSAILVSTDDYTQLYGKLLRIHGRSAKIKASQNDEFNLDELTQESAYDIIAKCTISASFDDRIFFSGNPSYPSAVFFSSRTSSGESSPAYVGALNYFHVGRADSHITSMLSKGGSLLVFKGDSERGGIYIYEGRDTQSDLIPRIYTLTDYAGGVGSVGGAYSFYGDTVFLSGRGVDAVSKKQLNGEISISHRSSNIDSALLKSSLEGCSICCWQGYLCILREGEIFLADSRRTFLHDTRDTQYEWYKLTGIGTYEGQYSRFFTIPLTKVYESLYVKYGEAYLPLEGKYDTGEDCDGAFKTYAYKLDDGEFKDASTYVYCCIIPDEAGIFHCYMCDCAGEMKGGEYFPATHLLSVGDVLFFGTCGGDLCCFNTDRRDENGNIDRRYYTFNGRRYYSGACTKSDDCDIPGMTKSTIKHSLCMHLKSFGSGRVKVAVRTDQGGYRQIADTQNGVFAFDDIEFDRFTFNTSRRTTLIIPEKEKRWSEKQFNIYSDEYMRPFGIYDISYRYKVAGRIKDK